MPGSHVHHKGFPDYDSHHLLKHQKRLTPITLEDLGAPQSEGQIVTKSSHEKKRYMLAMMYNTEGLVNFVQKLVKNYNFQVIAFGNSYKVLQKEAKIEV